MLDDNAPVDQVIHKQATVGDIIQRYIHGANAYDIAEEFGLDAEKVKEIIVHANTAGKFRPAGQPDELDLPEEAPQVAEAPAAPAPEVAPVVEAPAPVAEVPAEVAQAPAVDAPGPATTESNV